MKTSLLIFFFCTFSIVFSQTPTWQWARNYVGFNSDMRGLSAVGPDGSIYLAGNFADASVTIGNQTFANNVGTGNSGDIYLVKYDAQGNIVWARKDGGANFDSVTSVACDSEGNVLLLGTMTNGMAAGSFSITGTGSWVAKYTSAGEPIWLEAVASSGYCTAYKLKIDAEDNFYLSGFFDSESVVMGTQTMTNDNFNPEASMNGTTFVAKFDPDGDCIWASNSHRIGNSSHPNIGMDLAVDNSGNVFTAGTFFSPQMKFGDITISRTGATGSGPDIFMAKYGADGEIVWVKTTVSSFANHNVNSVVTDSDGNVFFSGHYTGVTNFDGTILSGGSGSKMFTAKYASDGNLLWIRSAETPSYCSADSAVVDSQGNFYLSGVFFGSWIIFGTQDYNGSADGNLFVAKYDLSGTPLWTKLVGPFNPNNRLSLTLRGTNDLILAGYFFGAQPLNFTDFLLPPVSSNAGLSCDIFISRLYAQPLSVENPDANSIVLYPNPVSDKIYLSGIEPGSPFVIYDSLGKVVSEGKTQSVLDLSHLCQGVYAFKAQTENGGLFVQKIVKE